MHLPVDWRQEEEQVESSQQRINVKISGKLTLYSIITFKTDKNTIRLNSFTWNASLDS